MEVSQISHQECDEIAKRLMVASVFMQGVDGATFNQHINKVKRTKQKIQSLNKKIKQSWRKFGNDTLYVPIITILNITVDEIGCGWMRHSDTVTNGQNYVISLISPFGVEILNLLFIAKEPTEFEYIRNKIENQFIDITNGRWVDLDAVFKTRTAYNGFYGLPQKKEL